MKLTWIKNTSPALISCASSIGACVSLAVVFSQVDISGGAPRPTSGPRPAAADPARYSPLPISPEMLDRCLKNGNAGDGPIQFESLPNAPKLIRRCS